MCNRYNWYSGKALERYKVRRYIEFVAVENKCEIASNYDYVKRIFEQLVKEKFVTSILVIPGTSANSAISEYDDESTCFSVDYNYKNNGKDNIWNLFFQFGTYDERLQLQISISSDTYTLDIDDDYLEKLKLSIKQMIVHDWVDIIWLMDEDSQCLSESIYPDVYSVENLLRRLINSVMVKVYGTKWWDLFVPYSIKMKHRNRLAGYKSVVPGFNNVDEKLMSIDIDDLFSIVTLERTKWNPKFEDEVSSQLNGMLPENKTKIIEILKGQMEKEISLWDKRFSKYLPESFKENFQIFEMYRNHIAHNKLIDRSAYRKIKEAANTISDNVKEAIKKSDEDILSAEDKIIAEREKEEYFQMLDECERENKKNDTGVNIRTAEEIQELLSDSVGEVISFLSESLYFREDIKFKTGEYDKCGQTAFEVISKINEETICVTVDFDLCDDEGTESSAILQYDDEKTSIRYINGEVEYDWNQGLYMPVIQDELYKNDVETAKELILEYINEITDIKGKAHAACEEAIMCGDTPPIAGYVECEECGEYEISVDDEFAPIGTCLNCGYKNSVFICDRCGSWFNTNIEGRYEEGGVTLCQNCLDDIMGE